MNFQAEEIEIYRPGEAPNPTGDQEQIEKPKGDQSTPDNTDTPAPEPDKPNPDEPQQQPAKQQQAPEPDYSWLEKVSEGSIKSPDQLSSVLKEYNQLKTAIQEPKEPEFPNEGAKYVYDFATKYAGQEKDAVQKFFQVTSIDLEKSEGRDVLFQQFMLENPELDSQRGRRIFDQQMEEEFPEDSLEENELLKFKYDKKVNSAKDSIGKLQREYQEALEAKPEPQDQGDPEALTKVTNEHLPNFKGLSMSMKVDDNGEIQFGEPDKENPVNNLSYNIPEEGMEEFKEALQDPSKFWQKQFLNEKGELDPQRYMSNMYKLMFADHIQKSMANDMYAKGQEAKLKELKGIPTEDLRGSQSQPHENPIVQGIMEAKRKQGLT